jgi:ribonuclease HIII
LIIDLTYSGDFAVFKSKTLTAKKYAKLQESNDFTESMKTFVYKTINEEGDKIKSHNVNHQFELEDSIISAFYWWCYRF